MFYNNVTEFGVLLVDNTQKDSTTRTSTNFEIKGTKFIDGPANNDNIDNATAPVITYVLSDAKNKFTVTDCEFIAKKDHTASPFVINCRGAATTSAIKDAIKELGEAEYLERKKYKEMVDKGSIKIKTN